MYRNVLSRLAVILLVITAVLCLAPVLGVLAEVFWHDGELSADALFVNPRDAGRMLTLFRNSVIVTAIALCVSLAIGVPVGFLCFRTDLPLRKWLIFACIPAAFVPVYVSATAWLALFGMEAWLSRAAGAGWIQGVAYLPVVILVSGAGFAIGDPELEAAASLDVGKRGVIRHVSIPQGSWGIGIAALIVTALSVADMTVTDMLVVRTFAEEVFTLFQLHPGEPWRAAAVTFPLIALLFLLGCWLWLRVRAHGEATVSGAMSGPSLLKLGGARIPVGILVAAVLAGLFAVPAYSLVTAIENAANLLTTLFVSGGELLWTAELAVVSASACALLAVPWAWVIVRRGRLRLLAALSVILLLSVPAPVAGMGLARMLGDPLIPASIGDSGAGVVFAWVIRAAPFAVIVMIPAVHRVPVELEDAGRLAGGTWAGRLTGIVAPMTWRSVIAAWLLAFSLSVADLGASFLVIPPGRTTVTVSFFQVIHCGVYPDAAAQCVVLILYVALPGTLAAALLWRGLAKRLL